jgi:transcriptional regulator with XRE-family HTH domain
MSSLGSAIRNARVRADLSQGEVARRLGISQGTISFWEHDVETPTLDNLIKLLAEFPDLLGDIRVHRVEAIRQLRQIERALFDGQCACGNCSCSTEADA